MKFVADESLDFPIVVALRTEGYDVYSIKEQSPRMDDEAILKIANEQKRILITCDKDFGELVFRLQLVSSGIVLLRLPELSNQKKIEAMLALVAQHGEILNSSFCVITSGKLRIVAI
jgi:predicted nuclease of predicted toxin-antitoxin system